jgi:hypothetical protein
MNLKKLFTQSALLLAVATSLYIISSLYLEFSARSGARLEILWKTDIENLSLENKLPLAWRQVRQIEKVAAQNDLVAELWVKTVSAPIEVNVGGEYKLEILFVSQKEDGSESAMIQHHLIHLPTGNSVWELGRTYQLE